MTDCTIAKTHFWSGCKIDCIENDGIPADNWKDFIQKYLFIMGCINWLCINTWPDIATVYKLLSQFNCKPPKGHMDAAKCVLKSLAHKFPPHGLWFKERENRLLGCASCHGKTKPTLYCSKSWNLYKVSIFPLWSCLILGCCASDKNKEEVTVLALQE